MTSTKLNIKVVHFGRETNVMSLYEQPSCVHRANRLVNIEFSSGIAKKKKERKQFCLLQSGKHKHKHKHKHIVKP